MGFYQSLQLLLAGLLVLGLTLFAGGCDKDTAAAPADYMPMIAGQTLTYKSVDGKRFTLTYGQTQTIEWFDGTSREVVPVRDSRCDCQILFRTVDGQVQAVGAIRAGSIAQWGEYVIVWPGPDQGEPEAVSTPAGHFDAARKVGTGAGAIWFAPGIGIVKTQQFELIATDVVY